MANYHGKNAKAYFKIGAGAESLFDTIRSWTCTLNAATADGTGMSANGRTRVAGINEGTCSVECVYQDDAYIQLDESDNAVYEAGVTGIKIELLRTGANASKGYAGGAILTGVNVGTAIDGTPIITYNFQWTGTVSGTTTAGT